VTYGDELLLVGAFSDLPLQLLIRGQQRFDLGFAPFVIQSIEIVQL
jgi:hypothetical protein